MAVIGREMTKHGVYREIHSNGKVKEYNPGHMKHPASKLRKTQESLEKLGAGKPYGEK